MLDWSLNKNANIVFISCSTGGNKGIAQRIRDELITKVRIFASPLPTSFDKIIFDGFGNIADIIYSTGGRVYKIYNTDYTTDPITITLKSENNAEEILEKNIRELTEEKTKWCQDRWIKDNFCTRENIKDVICLNEKYKEICK